MSGMSDKFRRPQIQAVGDAPLVIGDVLDLLAEDITEHPERVVPIPPALLERSASLTEGMDVDLDAESEGKVSIYGRLPWPCRGPSSRRPAKGRPSGAHSPRIRASLIRMQMASLTASPLLSRPLA